MPSGSKANDLADSDSKDKEFEGSVSSLFSYVSCAPGAFSFPSHGDKFRKDFLAPCFVIAKTSAC